jgi:Methylamine utilisation protein MauE
MERSIGGVLLGVILLATGIGKLLDVAGFIDVLRTYSLIPEWGLSATAVSLIVVELRIAERLLIGRGARQAALESVLLHLVFILVLVRTLWLGIPVPNCGCFGVFLARELTWWTVVEDGMMLLLSWRVWIRGALREKGESYGQE